MQTEGNNGNNGSGIHLTRQRRAILTAVRSNREHLDAASIYDRVREEMPKISLGTVYRSLAALRDAGEVLEIVPGVGPARYDGDVSVHQHACCTSCGKVVDLFIPVDDLLREARERSGFASINPARVDLHGVCLECAVER